MQSFLVAISSILTIGCIIPYLVDIVRGKTKPRIVTWFTWSLLSAITSAAAFSDGQYPAAILTAFGSLATLLVVLLGWKHGDRKFERLDIVCQVGALIGLALWFLFDSPALAVIATTTIDLIGAIPTVYHSWKRPYEETWITFFISGIAGLLTLFAAGNWQVTSVLAPAYYFLFNTTLAAIIILRQKYAVRGKPAESRPIQKNTREMV
jgi:hypothetical protein